MGLFSKIPGASEQFRERVKHSRPNGKNDNSGYRQAGYNNNRQYCFPARKKQHIKKSPEHQVQQKYSPNRFSKIPLLRFPVMMRFGPVRNSVINKQSHAPPVKSTLFSFWLVACAPFFQVSARCVAVLFKSFLLLPASLIFAQQAWQFSKVFSSTQAPQSGHTIHATTASLNKNIANPIRGMTCPVFQ
ncbi:MAG: hypothetical protein V1909_05505 [Candidatus Micrarchaeota archaeon]